MKAVSWSNGGFSYSLNAETGYGEFYSVLCVSSKVGKRGSNSNSVLQCSVIPQRKML